MLANEKGTGCESPSGILPFHLAFSDRSYLYLRRGSSEMLMVWRGEASGRGAVFFSVLFCITTPVCLCLCDLMLTPVCSMQYVVCSMQSLLCSIRSHIFIMLSCDMPGSSCSHAVLSVLCVLSSLVFSSSATQGNPTECRTPSMPMPSHHRANDYQVIIHQSPPTNAKTTRIVKIPAPALSAVVIVPV